MVSYIRETKVLSRISPFSRKSFVDFLKMAPGGDIRVRTYGQYTKTEVIYIEV